MAAPLTVEVIDRVVALPDPDRRSLVITQAYADLSAMVADAIDTRADPQAQAQLPNNANFWTFATWSAFSISRTLDRSLLQAAHQGESLANRARRILTPAAKKALASGEVRAFNDAARLAVAFCDAFQQGEHDRDAVADRCLAKLPIQPRSSQDVSDIGNGIRALVDASQPSPAVDPDHPDHQVWRRSRSQLILLSTILIDAAEQRIVQSALDDAFQAIPNRFLGNPRDPNIMRGGSRRISRAAGRQFGAGLRGLTSRLLTEWAFAVTLPDEVLSLGRDLPPLPDGRRFPAELTTITDPRLQRTLQRFDASHADGSGTGAHDWTIYDDRMSFIVNYLRRCQVKLSAQAQPFTLVQAARLRAFRSPSLEADEQAGILQQIRDQVVAVDPNAGAWGGPW